MFDGLLVLNLFIKAVRVLSDRDLLVNLARFCETD